MPKTIKYDCSLTQNRSFRCRNVYGRTKKVYFRNIVAPSFVQIIFAKPIVLTTLFDLNVENDI